MTSTKPTDCQQAIDVNVQLIEINKNIKIDYDNRVATALKNWQDALDPVYREKFMITLRSIYNSGYYVLKEYRKLDGTPVENEAFQRAGMGDISAFYKNNIVFEGELKSCSCGKGCCFANAGWCQKCCAFAWRPDAMNSKNFTCDTCSYWGCGDWWRKYTNSTELYPQLLIDNSDLNRLNTNLFEPYFVVEYNRHVSNLESLYRNIAPPEYMPTFNIACCQTILGSNVNAEASTITFDSMTNTCIVETNEEYPNPTTTSNTSTIGSTSGSTSSPIIIYTAQQIYTKITELPQEEQGAVWFAVACGILLALIIVIVIIMEIRKKHLERQNNNSPYTNWDTSTYTKL